mmetsp:Transcript_112194/g.312260  ORF Transcript_112194/g.312260 Transcript_112194/m.312260 type:complete len:127 (-) Transcript_112194:87-467(-)|eukprot:CAMPEP_0179120396 /NCGR_PEP_ID=MMETSP0796-20121207/56723_1 /TAXON_ID=73915 /ORGANISM="Pyrodinium bahamense, Strain pbaha01" /LENGTH=126 /DNA_ID=CAMNT_0020818935 /DNA_START=138 /DNA_END=518 /DNA_ORIENTATION=+
MGNRLQQGWSQATSCCNGDGDTGTLVVKGTQATAGRRKYPYSEESSGRREQTPGEEDLDGPEAVEVASPEVGQPVGVNAFDKLTHIHGQIQQQLAEQELLIHKLLQEGDALDGAFGIDKDDIKDSL